MRTSFSPKKMSIFPLLVVMLFDHTSLNITFPVLTLLFFDGSSSLFAPDTSHAVRSMWYGFAVAVPHLINILVTPILSASSDEFGRKKILLIGTLGAVLFAVIAGFGVLWGMLSLLFSGLLIRGAFSRTNPIAQAIVGDISPKDKKVRNMGYLQFAIGVGASIGPLLGGYFANQFYFQQLNFSLPFFIAALFAGMSSMLTLLIFKETLLFANRSSSLSIFNLAAFKKVLMKPQVLRVSAILLLSQISWSLYYQFMPPILKTTLNFDSHLLGLFVGMIAFWLAVATGFGIRLLEKFFSLSEMLFFSLYLVLSGLVLSMIFCLYPANFNMLLIWIAAIPTAIGDVIAFSCLITLYSDGVEKEEQGKVMGICFIVVAIIWSLTGLIGGALMSFHELLPLIVAPLGILFSIILLHSKFEKSLT
jgi:DHA1 family tetracycline resistance protein-like MFS transporter